MLQIFGNWEAIPEQLRDIIESNKTLTDPLGRAHNRLAAMISKIQRISPEEPMYISIPEWEKQLHQALSNNRNNTILRLRSIIIKYSIDVD